jgi:hypothetical protein
MQECKVYRIPTKKGFAKMRVDKTKTWTDVYGNARCAVCKKHFEEGHLYTLEGNGSGKKTKYKHYDCKHPKKIE